MGRTNCSERYPLLSVQVVIGFLQLPDENQGLYDAAHISFPAPAYLQDTPGTSSSLIEIGDVTRHGVAIARNKDAMLSFAEN